MAEVSIEMIHEILMRIQDRVETTVKKVDELKAEMQAFRSHMISLQQDVHNIYDVLAVVTKDVVQP
ncbi:MAG: hypothetical protein WD036_03345 [Bauldia sp.]